MNIPISLRKIFWDIDLKTAYDKKSCGFIVERIAEKGDKKAVQWLLKNFNKKEIYNIIKKSKNVTTKTKNFYQVIK